MCRAYIISMAVSPERRVSLSVNVSDGRVRTNPSRLAGPKKPINLSLWASPLSIKRARVLACETITAPGKYWLPKEWSPW